jgi:hypothetical protein
MCAGDRPAPSISAFFGVVIYLYFSDHAPPHFHAEYGEFEAVYNFDRRVQPIVDEVTCLAGVE